MTQEDREITLVLPLSVVGVVVQSLNEIQTKYGRPALDAIEGQLQQQLAPTPIKKPKGEGPAAG